MSDQMRVFEKKIKTMHSLKSIIKTMKILAAINIVSYEKSLRALEHYDRSVKLGLVACLLQSSQIVQDARSKKSKIKRTAAVVFGSDQGMVGQFNDQIAQYAYHSLGAASAKKIIWPIGERVFSRLVDYTGLIVNPPLEVPTAISHVSDLVSEVLDAVEKEQALASIDQLFIFYNRSKSGATFEPACLQLLPLDMKWIDSLLVEKWPTDMTPEAVDGVEFTFEAMLRQHLFISIIKASIESLASENACRLASMQVAEKHVDELLERQNLKYYQERQSRIDEELFDVISGFEVLRSENLCNVRKCP